MGGSGPGPGAGGGSRPPSAAAAGRELAGRMLGGDERAFDEFFDAHFPGLYRFALARLGRDADAAEEVAQATICRAIAKLHTYRGEAALSTWLFTFCRHEVAAHCARESRASRRLEAIDDRPDGGDALAAATGELADPEAAADRAETARLVQAALDRLPPSYGSALEWKYLEGASVKEIAARLEVTAKAAESLLTRARDAFRGGFTLLVEGASRRARPRRTEPSP